MKNPPPTCIEPGKVYFSQVSKNTFGKKPCTTTKGWTNRLRRWMARRADAASIRWHYAEFGCSPQ